MKEEDDRTRITEEKLQGVQKALLGVNRARQAITVDQFQQLRSDADWQPT